MFFFYFDEKVYIRLSMMLVKNIWYGMQLVLIVDLKYLIRYQMLHAMFNIVHHCIKHHQKHVVELHMNVDREDNTNLFHRAQINVAQKVCSVFCVTFSFLLQTNFFFIKALDRME